VQRQLEQEEEFQKCLDGALDTQVSQLEKRFGARLEEHRRWLSQLSQEVTDLGKAPLGPTSSAGALRERLAALERGQKTVAVGARRALHTALVVHQHQQSQDQESEWDKCLESLPVAELEQQCAARFTEQDERLDAVLQIVDSLVDRVMITGLKDGPGGEPRSMAAQLEALEASLTEKVEEAEANLYGIASQLESKSGSGQLQVTLMSPHSDRRELAGAMESLEARLAKSMSEMGQRLDDLQDGRDQQRLVLRQLSQQVPEVVKKLDQLWTQCQHYFPRVKEHDVHFSFFRTSFENHKQQMLELADGWGARKDRLHGTSTSTSPTDYHFGAEGPTHAHLSSGDGLRSPYMAPSSCGDESELRARSSMLAQVMARLRASSPDGDHGAPGGGAGASRPMSAGASVAQSAHE